MRRWGTKYGKKGGGDGWRAGQVRADSEPDLWEMRFMEAEEGRGEAVMAGAGESFRERRKIFQKLGVDLGSPVWESFPHCS